MLSPNDHPQLLAEQAPIPMSQQRLVKLNEWYSTAQIGLIGRAWCAQRPQNRFFACTEEANRCGLTLEGWTGELEYPYQMILPISSGAHWVSFSVLIERDEEDKLTVHIVFSDSANSSLVVPQARKAQIEHIQNICRQKLGADITFKAPSVYQHQWQQEDNSSCGAYCLKNAMRYLEGAGKEHSIGREAIRNEQLDMMQSQFSADQSYNASVRIAIKGCSVNNLIVEMLRDWILESVSKGDYGKLMKGIDQSFKDADDVLALIRAYVARSALPEQEQVLQIEKYRDALISEYGTNAGSIRHVPLNVDLNYLLAHDPIIQKATKGSLLAQQIEGLGQTNIVKQLELIRKAIVNVTNDDILSYNHMIHIIEFMLQNEVEEVNAILEPILKSCPDTYEATRTLLGQIPLIAELQRDFKNKLSGFKKLYHNIKEATQQIKTLDRPNLLATDLLRAHMNLLDAAIARDNAGLLGKVAYLINDFCSQIAEILSFGSWKPDYKKIFEVKHILARRLVLPDGQPVTKEQLQIERDSIDELVRSTNKVKFDIFVEENTRPKM